MTTTEISTDHWPLPDVDLLRPHAGRIVHHLLGGDEGWSIDRRIAERATAILPGFRDLLRFDRLFRARAIDLCVDRGVHQFIDLGCGVPVPPMTHELVAGTSLGRCVYVETEPVAVAHTTVDIEKRGDPRRHVVLRADLRAARHVWDAAQNIGGIDPDRRVGLLLTNVLHFIAPGDGAEDALADYIRLLPRGSYVVASQLTADAPTDQMLSLRDAFRDVNPPLVYRAPDAFAALFDGLDLVAPGVAPLTRWYEDHRARWYEHHRARWYEHHERPPAPDSDSVGEHWLAAIGRTP